jgi:hypothetical protein
MDRISCSIRTLKYVANATAASNDLQEVQSTIALNYHISPDRANIIYQQLGADYADRIIAPTIQESVKASVAKFNAEELITKRATAKAVIAETHLQWLSIKRWNGQLPYALGSGGSNSGSGFPFFQLPKLPSKQQPLAPTRQQTAQQNLTRH